MPRSPLLLLALALALASPSAFAADDWTGWHLGIHAGQGSGDSRARLALAGEWSIETPALRDDVVSAGSADLDPDGSALGLAFGYDHQFANGFVLGAELEYSALDIDDTRQTGPQPAASAPGLEYDFGNRISLDDQWALRLRLGYASGSHLFFASAGAVQVDATAVATVASNGGYLKRGEASERLDGTEWGVGYAYDFGNRWALRLEFLSADLDEVRYDTAYLPGSTFTAPPYLESVAQGLDLDTWRLGLEYRF